MTLNTGQLASRPGLRWEVGQTSQKTGDPSENGASGNPTGCVYVCWPGLSVCLSVCLCVCLGVCVCCCLRFSQCNRPLLSSQFPMYHAAVLYKFVCIIIYVYKQQNCVGYVCAQNVYRVCMVLSFHDVQL